MVTLHCNSRITDENPRRRCCLPSNYQIGLSNHEITRQLDAAGYLEYTYSGDSFRDALSKSSRSRVGERCHSYHRKGRGLCGRNTREPKKADRGKTKCHYRFQVQPHTHSRIAPPVERKTFECERKSRGASQNLHPHEEGAFTVRKPTSHNRTGPSCRADGSNCAHHGNSTATDLRSHSSTVGRGSVAG